MTISHEVRDRDEDDPVGGRPAHLAYDKGNWEILAHVPDVPLTDHFTVNLAKPSATSSTNSYSGRLRSSSSGKGIVIRACNCG